MHASSCARLPTTCNGTRSRRGASLWSDEEVEGRWTRDPVAAASRSERCLRKVQRKHLEDGSDVHKFQTLLASLSTITCNICCRRGAGPDEPTFLMVTIPNAE